jgi:hypothetical protein
MIFKFSDLKIIKSGKGARWLVRGARFRSPLRFPAAASGEVKPTPHPQPLSPSEAERVASDLAG